MLMYASDLTVSAAPYEDGKWHLLTGTFDGSTATIYIDGVQKNSTSVTYNTGSSVLDIGRAVTGSYYLTGALDDVRVYNRALSSSEVKELYNMGK